MLNQNPFCRRTFLTSAASGLGGLALAGMMDQDATRADESQSALAVRAPPVSAALQTLVPPGPPQEVGVSVCAALAA